MDEKELSLFDCVMLGVGSALGPEIFLLLGLAGALAGTQAVISIAIAFVIAMLVGLCYAELATAIPTSGEDYVFARSAFKGMLPFIVGWIVWFGNIVYVSFNAIAVAYFLKVFIPVPVGLTAVSFIVFAGALLYLGMRTMKCVQNVLVTTLILLLAVLVYFSFSFADWSYLSGFLGGGDWKATFSTAAMLFIAFIGFEDIVSVSAEVKEPRKTIPLAIILSLVILAVIYIAVSLIVFAVLPLSAVAASENVVLDVAEIAMGDVGKLIFSIAGLLAIATSINAAMTAGTMNAFALGRDGYLPKKLAVIGPHHSAAGAIVLTAALAILFAATESVSFVVYLTDFAYFMAIAISACALIRLRKTQPSLKRPFKVPFYPYIPYAAMALSIIAIFTMKPLSMLIGILWLLAGVLVYYLYVIGMDRIKMAFGGVSLLFSAICFTAYFLVDGAYFALPTSSSFNLNGVILLIAIAFGALAGYLILFTKKPNGSSGHSSS